jgi:hypothetical protein
VNIAFVHLSSIPIPILQNEREAKIGGTIAN